LGSLRQIPRDVSWLPFGNGRSYGDSCLNDGGLLIHTRGIDRFMSFDRATGRLACESGVLLSEILQVAVPRGWFLCVTPGTQFVTVGGAIANDVHGKNHHVSGTFGKHVLRFELLRSDGSRRICSLEENADLYRATIGGLGLTGLIQWAEIQLKPVASTLVRVETVKFGSLDEFFSISSESDRAFEYTVAWIDCMSGRAAGTRGHFIRGAHADAATSAPSGVRPPRTLVFPIDPPLSLVNRASLRVFNAAYYHRQKERTRRQVVHYAPFFYPLDRIAHWNRMYGRNGFFQFQCAIPHAGARNALDEMMSAIAASGQGSFLAVLKEFGDVASPGLLSFPRPGATLALDFPNAGSATVEILDRLEAITMAARGALYPAKDARMSGKAFRLSFPMLEQFIPHVDPQFSSSFWRRVNA
jgi:FAD/FMN-containing dehydrogenase